MLFVPQAPQSSPYRRAEFDIQLAIPPTHSVCGMEICMKKIFFILVGVIAVIISCKRFNNTEDISMQKDIAKRILRFHVVANSDSEEDQALKIKVKDAVITYLSPLLSDSQSLEESISIAEQNYDSINDIARHVIVSEGYDYDVKCCIERTIFPVKCYGDVALPAGEYTALNIQIGNSAGKNWWCILYPPLCFVDASSGVVPDSSKEQLQDTLTEEEYRSILNEPEKLSFDFKYLKFLK